MPSKNLLRDARILRRILFDRASVDDVAREFYLSPKSIREIVRQKLDRPVPAETSAARGVGVCHAALVARAANSTIKCPHCLQTLAKW